MRRLTTKKVVGIRGSNRLHPQQQYPGYAYALLFFVLATLCYNHCCNAMHSKCVKYSSSRYKQLYRYDIRETERAANNCSCGISESVITNCSPRAVVVNFKTSFSWTWASNQSHCERHTVNMSYDKRLKQHGRLNFRITPLAVVNKMAKLPYLNQLHTLRAFTSTRRFTFTRITKTMSYEHSSIFLSTIFFSLS